MTKELRVLEENEINAVSGGFLCGGLCLAAAVGGAVIILKWQGVL